MSVDYDKMNRYELINEIEKLKKFDKTDEYYRSLVRERTDNERLHEELDALQSQCVILAEHLDALGRQPGMEAWLDVADGLRTRRLATPLARFVKSRRDASKERRRTPQGRRKTQRRR